MTPSRLRRVLPRISVYEKTSTPADLVRANLEQRCLKQRCACRFPFVMAAHLARIRGGAQHCGLTTEGVAELHSSVVYEVHAVGFTPGFPIWRGWREIAHAATSDSTNQCARRIRRIGESKRGLSYEQPRGWQLIGRTPRSLFEVQSEPPRCAGGDRVKFVPLSEEVFRTWR